MNRRHFMNWVMGGALAPKPRYRTYRDPKRVGYAGWWEWMGRTVAFTDLQGRMVRMDELDGS